MEMDRATTKERKEQKVKSSSSTDQDQEESYSTCPLFMDGLPKDFASNPSLAAIASLLEDNEDKEIKKNLCRKNEDESNEAFANRGGGKVTTKKKNSRRSKPYSCDEKKKKASIGEAQLFMSMWKI